MFLEGERQSGDSRSFFFYFCKNYDCSHGVAELSARCAIAVCANRYAI